MVPPAKLGCGRWAVVAGRDEPGAEPTVTTGIVSALGRHGGTAFELDASVNYGSAGGAVADIRGRLMGLASRVMPSAPQGVDSGVAFAVPAAGILAVLPDLKAGRTIEASKPPFLGVAFEEGDAGTDGVLLSQVVPGSGAERGGLQPGDVVVAVDGKPVFTRIELVGLVGGFKPGERLEITVRREGGTRTLPVVLSERP